MVWQIALSSLILGEFLLVPLAYKWQLKLKIGLLFGFIFGSLSGIINIGFHYYFPGLQFFILLIFEIFFIILFTALAIINRFFRDPERKIPERSNVIVSPADGTIRYILNVDEGQIPISIKGKHFFPLSEITKTDLLQNGSVLIGIEMSVLDVHINRAPLDGKIIYQRHIGGKFLSLRSIEALLTNERVTTVIDHINFKIGIVQIASRLVRRIVSYLNEGECVNMGQRIGMIKFGSQVDLVIPQLDGIKIRVEPGDVVRAGSTIICEYEIE